ncbi:hypothetical protein BZG36_05162, partial [Bifiguratus adelaidae]
RGITIHLQKLKRLRGDLDLLKSSETGRQLSHGIFSSVSQEKLSKNTHRDPLEEDDDEEFEAGSRKRKLESLIADESINEQSKQQLIVEKEDWEREFEDVEEHSLGEHRQRRHLCPPNLERNSLPPGPRPHSADHWCIAHFRHCCLATIRPLSSDTSLLVVSNQLNHAFVVGFLLYVAFSGYTYTITLMFQVAFGYSALTASLYILPAGIVAFIVSVVVAVIAPFAGSKYLIVAGAFFMTAAMVFSVFFSPEFGFWKLIFPMDVVLCLGMPVAYISAINAMVVHSPPEESGTVGAVYNTGGSNGICRRNRHHGGRD